MHNTRRPKDRKTATDFFLGLMHDLTAMMVEGEEGEQELELPPIRQGEVGRPLQWRERGGGAQA